MSTRTATRRWTCAATSAPRRAKIVYEYLLQFTDDAGVQDTLRFLMTREVAHMNQFTAALESIKENFPPGVLQADPRFEHKAFNMSEGSLDGSVRGPWNEGQGPWPNGEQWEYIENPDERLKSEEHQNKGKQVPLRTT
jgi:Mn-containing catalase